MREKFIRLFYNKKIVRVLVNKIARLGVEEVEEADYYKQSKQLKEANEIIRDVANQELSRDGLLDSRCESTYEGLLSYLETYGAVKAINSRLYEWIK